MHIITILPKKAVVQMKSIFIDGKAGTTGLRIYDRLKERTDISLITLSEEERKNAKARAEAINSSDVTFLCLPDDAAREAVSMVKNPDTVIIDTSTAHRTDPAWAYGFPELSSEHEEKIRTSKRIAVPGCHAGGFIALVYPLIEAGIIDKELLLTCYSVTGYSGGGKKMIAEYEAAEKSALLSAPRQYGLGQCHKHLREMKAVTGLSHEPVFSPFVAPFYSGMEVTVPLFKENLKKPGECIKEVYKNKYTGPVVFFDEAMGADGFISAAEYSGRDIMKIGVLGNEDRLILVALYDNLGKGASGAALENLNIITGVEKNLGLEI